NQYLSKAKAFIFPSEEDFGIVPVEAQACGTPVIAFGKGGALETVVPIGTAGKSPTGMFFNEQNALSIIQAVIDFEANASHFVPAKIHDHAQDFAIPKFKEKFQIEIEKTLNTYK
ncbi:MAG: hypothetical protein RL535_994, partial [Pseudomonadota bacterium]